MSINEARAGEYDTVGYDIDSLTPTKLSLARPIPDLETIQVPKEHDTSAFAGAIPREGRRDLRLLINVTKLWHEESAPTVDEVHDGHWYKNQNDYDNYPELDLVDDWYLRSYDRDLPEDDLHLDDDGFDDGDWGGYAPDTEFLRQLSDTAHGGKYTEDNLWHMSNSPDWRDNYPDCYAPDEYLGREVSELDLMLEGLPKANGANGRKNLEISDSPRNAYKRDIKLKRRDWVENNLNTELGEYRNPEEEIWFMREGKAPTFEEFYGLMDDEILAKESDEVMPYSSDRMTDDEILAEYYEVMTSSSDAPETYRD